MKVFQWVSMLLVVGGVVLSAPAGELFEKAAPLSIKEWVKGEPVDVTKADGKNIYVVEFWATWCGPCVKSIPHLTEMQKKYKDKHVTFIGVSVDDEKTVANVKPFVKKMGDKMDYVVALDKDGETSKAYMDKFGIRGIPHAFVVDQKGRIAWEGHPADNFEDVVELVAKGNFDQAAADKLIAKREAERKEMMAKMEQETRERQAVMALLDEYMTLVQSKGDPDNTAALARKIIKQSREHPMILNDLAWRVLTDEGVITRDFKLALEAAEIANDATDNKEPAIMDTYALALFENGRVKEAIKVQTEAIELVKNDPMLDRYLGEFEERLEKFKKADKEK